MEEACGDPLEPDLVLAVVPPVPRRLPWAASPPVVVPPAPGPPVATPPPVPVAPSPPPSSPALPPDSGTEAPAIEVGAEAAADRALDRRFWTSSAVSTVVHVVVLTILALIVTGSDDVPRPRPFEIVQAAVEPEPEEFSDPEELAAVEIEPPAPGDEPVQDEPMLVEVDAADADAAAFAEPDEAVGIPEVDPDSLLERIVGAGAGGGRGAAAGGGDLGGFGGDVGRRLAAAGAKSGDIQVSLSWDDFNDIDLHVIAPSGERIYFGHRVSRCLGMLDVDMNAAGPATREPVENVFWPANRAPLGDYRVLVHHFARHDPDHDETTFTIHVLVAGERRSFTGSVKSGDPPVLVTRFTKEPERAAEPGGSDEFVE